MITQSAGVDVSFDGQKDGRGRRRWSGREDGWAGEETGGGRRRESMPRKTRDAAAAAALAGQVLLQADTVDTASGGRRVKERWTRACVDFNVA